MSATELMKLMQVSGDPETVSLVLPLIIVFGLVSVGTLLAVGTIVSRMVFRRRGTRTRRIRVCPRIHIKRP